MADVSESFNFYDLYGYLFPGVALTLIFLFPFWCYKRAPAADFGLGSALAATIAAYIAGHLLQTVAVSALPSKFADRQRVLRYPSEFILDADDTTFIHKVKLDVTAEVRQVFGIDVNDAMDRSSNRRDAFFLCRDALVAAKQATYVEQYQGMYSLMRGLCAALLLGSAYLAGWAVAFAHGHHSVLGERIVLPVGILLALLSSAAAHFRRSEHNPAFEHRAGICLVTGLALVLAVTGHFCGVSLEVTRSQSVAFAVASAASLLLFFRCYGAYEIFAREYAKAVWRGFLALRRIPPASGPSR